MKRVLVVEDDEDLAEALAFALREWYQVDVAFDGRAGLRKLTEAHFDAAVVDLVMPGLDGASMITMLRAQGSTLPVIVSTGTPELSDIAEDLHVDRVLAKPYDVEALVEAIDAATER